MEALRNRQQAELNKIVEREKIAADLQLKIKRAEEEEAKKQKIHAKKVAEQKLQEEKKRLKIEEEKKQKEYEEAEEKKRLMKKEAEVAEKLAKNRLQMERQIAKEARMKEEERKAKLASYAEKTASLIRMQEEQAERNRLKMLEREKMIQDQLIAKKLQKAQEVEESRNKAAALIAAAIHAHHEKHAKKKQEFADHQAAAEARARKLEAEERERLRKQADDIEKRNRVRLGRLIDAFRTRSDKRESIVERRQEKDTVYEKIEKQRQEEVAMLKFSTELKLHDKLENVERQARVNEFKRLQTLQRISKEDEKYEEIQRNKRLMAQRHAEEAKAALTRKHEISDTMEKMKMTNDFTLLDKLFSKKEKRDSTTRAETAGGTVKTGGLGDEPETEERFATTA